MIFCCKNGKLRHGNVCLFSHGRTQNKLVVAEVFSGDGMAQGNMLLSTGMLFKLKSELLHASHDKQPQIT